MFVTPFFASIFLEAKKRLKLLLNQKFIYTDGLRPDELAARLRNIKNMHGVFEDDLTKQDRQTDLPILDVEFAIYELLGVHPAVLASYRTCHELYKMQGTFTKGKL